MKPITIILCFLALTGCGGKDSPKPPSSALLVFPQKNSECNTGLNVAGTNTSTVEFRWQGADHTESYELRATNLNTNTTQTIVVSGTSANLTIEKGTPYSWLVVSKNTKVPETARSETWQFFNAGAETTHPPFPAAVISPKTGSNIARDINNEVLLDWEGADVDNDLEGYEVYFSTETPPTTLIGTLTSGQSSLKVSVAANTVYYWRIITMDREGNTATNTISEFKVR
ncbi:MULTISPECIES: hypothetical protein [unclassified Arenibacter]|uniref:hypothetical protein n=1 Tax=unclassified Arenibacter TaxID=2615047 RepID=UPI000E3483BF|nr:MULTISPECIES: hypothetical protein [unclassified Arenibacter]MCM4162343.1 hypothetical protein [Arenibacter sp. A80]RFT57941.1 hypothetical protein D0S24_01920 [Arenibacter sp. P308M17]